MNKNGMKILFFAGILEKDIKSHNLCKVYENALVGIDVKAVFVKEDGKLFFLDNPNICFENNLITILEQKCKGFKPDVIIVQGPTAVPLVYGIEKSPYPTVCLMNEWKQSLNNMQNITGMFDIVLCSKTLFNNMRTKGINNVHYFGKNRCGYDPEIFRLKNEKRIYDIIYIGNFSSYPVYKKRLQLIKRLSRLKNKYNLFFSFTSSNWNEEYVNILNRSKIVFNYTDYSWVNTRTFEALACGALPLMEEGNLEAPDCFSKDSVVLFNDDNLEEIIEYYLKNDAERNEMVNRGWAEAKQYTWKNFLFSIISKLNHIRLDNIKKEERSFFSLPEAEKHNIRARQAFFCKTPDLYFAKSELIKVVEVDPLNIKTLNNLVAVSAALWKKTGDDKYFYDAINTFNRAIEIDDYFLLYFNISGLYLEKGDYNKAKGGYLVSMKLLEEKFYGSDEFRELFFPYNFSFEFEVLINEALFSYTRDDQGLVKKLKDIFLSRILENIGDLFFMQKYFSEAKRYYFDSINKNKDYAIPLYKSALTLVSLNKLTEAKEMFERFIDQVPFYPRAIAAYGDLLKKMKRFDEYNNLKKDYEPFLLVLPEVGKYFEK